MCERIADDDGGVDRARLVRIVGAVSLVVGLAAVLIVATVDYTLAYHDARARLVVARRVFDSLTPGLGQLGGIWLPLPHLWNLPLVHVDGLYRTGLGSVLVNVVAFGVVVASTASIVVTITGRAPVAVAAAALVAAHPDLIFLQATPMTEPLALALLGGAVALFVLPGGRPVRTWAGAGLLALAILTRYEAWPVAAAIATLAVFTRQETSSGESAWRRYPLLAVGLLVPMALAAAGCWSRATTGSWLVTSGFFHATDSAGQPLGALIDVLAMAARATGPGLLVLAIIGVCWLAWDARTRPARRRYLLTAAPLAAGLLFWYAAHAGHPILARYGVFLVVPSVWLAAIGASVLHARGRRVTLMMLLVLSAVWSVQLWASPPVIREAAVDARVRDLHRPAFEALAQADGQSRVLASMWSSAHVLHELAAFDIPLRRVIHEGNGPVWRQALAAPERWVDWIVLACRGSANDRLFRTVMRSPAVMADFDLAARAGSYEVYRRRTATTPRTEGPPRRRPCASDTSPG